MRRIYVAASSMEIERAKRCIAWAIEDGHVVTHDWPSVIEAHGEANPTGEGWDLSRRRDVARSNVDGVWSANVLWMLAPETPTVGAWVELGVAIAVKKSFDIDIIVSGPAYATASIFAGYADAIFETDLAARKHLSGSD